MSVTKNDDNLIEPQEAALHEATVMTAAAAEEEDDNDS